MPRRSSSFLLLVFLLGLVGCDHATKRLAETRLRGHAPTTLIANVFELRYTENRDVAFSLLRRVPPSVRTPLIFVAGAIGHGLLLLLWWRRRNARWGEQLAYAIILAGALGNLTDRLVRGYVVDFLYVHHWPVFNVADICLVVGVGLMLLMTRHQGDPAHPTAPPTPAG